MNEKTPTQHEQETIQPEGRLRRIGHAALAIISKIQTALPEYESPSERSHNAYMDARAKMLNKIDNDPTLSEEDRKLKKKRLDHNMTYYA
jgi:hypothetical protein